MALQTLVTIVVADQTNPTEVQTWFTNNPLAAITSIVISGNVFYIIHT